MNKQKNNGTRKLFVLLLVMTLLTIPIVQAANNPGHDTLYVLKDGDNVSGIFNLTSIWINGTDGGYVGIGTSNPGAKLTIHQGYGINTNELRFTADDDTSSPDIVTTGSIEASVTNWGVNDLNSSLIFKTIKNNVDYARLVIDTEGNVGIGTTAPTQKLDVNGSINITTGYDVCIEGGKCLSTTGTGSGDVTDVNQGTGIIVTSPTGPAPSVAVNTTYLNANYVEQNEYPNLDTDSTNDLTNTGFDAGNITSGTIPDARIASSSTWNAKAASANCPAGQVIMNTTSSGVQCVPASADTDDQTLQEVTDQGTTTTDAITIDSNGNEQTNIGGTLYINGSSNGDRVGIGTTSPGRKLSLEGNDVYAQFNDTVAGEEWTIGSDGAGFVFYSDTDATYRMVIDNTGNVGIGTTSPNDILHVSKASADTRVRIGNNGAYDQYIYFNGNNDWSVGMDYSNSNAFTLSRYSSLGTNTVMVVTTSGKVGIADTTPGELLEVAGNINSTGGDICVTGGNCLSAMTGNTGDLTDVLQGTGIIVTSGGGPQPSVAVNTTYLDANYVGQSEYPTLDTDSTDDVTGSGTTNTIPKFTGSATVGNSKITDDGTIIAIDTSDLYVNTSSGNIGIGTTSTTRKLEVADFVDNDSIIVSASSHTAGIGVDSRGTYWGATLFSDGTRRLTVDSNGGLVIGSTYLGSGAAPSNGAIIEGSVGIGDNSPGEKLEVAGNINSTGGDICVTGGNCLNALTDTNAGTICSTGQFLNGDGTCDGGYLDADGTDDDTPDSDAEVPDSITINNGVLYAPTSGNLGIGTTNPNDKLEVAGGVRLNTTTSKPTCDSTHRGTLWFEQSGTSTNDYLFACMKNSTESYNWVQVAIGG